MSDEFMNGVGNEPENSSEEPQGYTQPEHTAEASQEYSLPEQNTDSYYSKQNYNQSQYDPNNLGKPDYSQMNYEQNVNMSNGFSQAQYQQLYGQQYQQPGMATKNDGTGFGIASLVLGIISIFMVFCCINYILAILAIIFGIVQIVRSKQKGLAIGGIITAAISIIGATIFWIFVSVAGSSAVDEIGPLQDYIQEYIEQNNEAF